MAWENILRNIAEKSKEHNYSTRFFKQCLGVHTSRIYM